MKNWFDVGSKTWHRRVETAMWWAVLWIGVAILCYTTFEIGRAVGGAGCF